MLHAVTHQKVSTIHIPQSAQARTPWIFFFWGIPGFSHLLFTLIFNKKYYSSLLLIICLANKTHFMIIIVIELYYSQGNTKESGLHSIASH